MTLGKQRHQTLNGRSLRLSEKGLMLAENMKMVAQDDVCITVYI